MKWKHESYFRASLWFFVTLLSAGLLMTNACGGEQAGQKCVAGQTQDCVCENGNKGSQSCDASGDHWGACDCSLTIIDGGTSTPESKSDGSTAPDKSVAPDKSDGSTTPDKSVAPDKPTIPDTQILDIPLPKDTGSLVDKPSTGTYHPAGWSDPRVHGLEAKMNKQDCRKCHGQDLKGGSAGVSCDKCHTPGWRTNCTFCHGKKDNQTGAPPRDINGNTDISKSAFRPHSPHVMKTIHGAYGCQHCHKKPTNVLSPGHIFDATPGKAEVDFSGGLSKTGVYSPTKGCSQLYCHGNGRSKKGAIAHTAPKRTCSSCHASAATRSKWPEMSGKHSFHMRMGRKGISCNSCHSSVDKTGTKILKPEVHVNGKVEFVGPTGFKFDAQKKTCVGRCHSKYHFYKRW